MCDRTVGGAVFREQASKGFLVPFSFGVASNSILSTDDKMRIVVYKTGTSLYLFGTTEARNHRVCGSAPSDLATAHSVEHRH